MRRILLAGVLATPAAYAHCPLCTIGAAAAAGGAAYLGVGYGAIGVFIGAFAVSIGWWIARMIEKQYVRFQKELLILGSFVLTVVPLVPLFDVNAALYLPWIGEYGRVFAINEFVIGSLIGGGIVWVAPLLSDKVSDLRGTQIPYQGIAITFALLIALAGILQVTL